MLLNRLVVQLTFRSSTLVALNITYVLDFLFHCLRVSHMHNVFKDKKSRQTWSRAGQLAAASEGGKEAL